MSEARVTYLAVPEHEPADQLSAIDRSILNRALDLYYTEMEAHREDHEMRRTAALSRRLADVSKTWKAEP